MEAKEAGMLDWKRDEVERDIGEIKNKVNGMEKKNFRITR